MRQEMVKNAAEPIKAARPHLTRAAVEAVIAAVALVAGSIMGQLKDDKSGGVIIDPATATEKTSALIATAVLVVAGVLAVRSLAAAIRAGASARHADARGTSVAFLVSLLGYAIVVIAALGLLDQPLQGLLLGGAVTGVVLGIAAQQTLGNFFAGLVLLVVKPFTVGEHVVMRSGPLGEHEGLVVDMSLFYVDLVTDSGEVKLPNAGVLASAIGPGARSKKDDPEPEEEEAHDPGIAGGGSA
jgi:small conductance mechanosensitive channel